ncbi:MAG: hypothetical protein JST44_16685 [Cyanobacteria bacterium SZAS LIN-5]|nr:hypothetical protein [Cyanobacteria bacterium SZAS LIN-5]
MPNEDEEPKIANLPGYQFFSTDLNYNYFGDQSASTPDVLATSAGSSSLDLLTTSAGSSSLDLLTTSADSSSSLDLLTTSSGSSSLDLLTTSAGASSPNLLTTSIGSSAPNLLTTSAGSSAPNSVGTSAGPSTPNSVKTSAVSSAQNAPVVENSPVRVAYSLTEDGPEPTFEERVAAMEREIAAADAASDAARTPNSFAAPVTCTASAPAPVSAVHTTPVTSPGYVAQQATTPVQSEPKWNQYVEPSVVPDVFSSTFNFNRSLLKIFWRIDIDHNNRVSKNELAIALQENWFEGDERVLAKLLYESYEDISPETIFCDAGLSVNNILSFGPFAEMAASQLESQIPEPVRPEKSARPAQKKSNNKSAQSLRSLFKR